MDYNTSGSATSEQRLEEIDYLIEVQESIIERAQQEISDLHNEYLQIVKELDE